MPSSTLVACRASVMLGSLVAVPAAALFWPSFPTTVDSLWASVRPPQAEAPGYVTPSGPVTRSELAEAPRFEPPATRGPLDFAQPTSSTSRNMSFGQGVGLLPVAGVPSTLNTASQSAAHAHPLAQHEQPQLIAVGGPQSSAEPMRQNHRATPASFAESRRAATSRERMSPAGTHPTSLHAPASTGDAPRFEGKAADQANTAASDALARLQGELRRRGVTYSLLETWGAESNQYRFHCKVAVAGNTRYYRNFESINADPLTAMRQVLGQIEAWQSGNSF